MSASLQVDLYIAVVSPWLDGQVVETYCYQGRPTPLQVRKDHGLCEADGEISIQPVKKVLQAR